MSIKTLPMSEIDDSPAGTTMADWKADPAEILDAVGIQLDQFGLEVVVYENGDDTYTWGIRKKRAPAPRNRIRF